MANFDLISRLQKYSHQTPLESDIDEKILDFLLHHLHYPKLTLTEISEACFVSKASVSRFIRKLGYTNFNDFLQDYHGLSIARKEARIDVHALKKRTEYNDWHFLEHYLDLLIEDLQSYRQHLNLKEIERLCDLIHQYDHVYFFATMIPGNMTEILQHQLLSDGKFIYYHPLYERQLAFANQLDDQSLAVFISLEGSYITKKELTLSITGSEARTVLITQNPQMKFSSLFDEILPLGDHNREASGKYKLLIFMEMVLHRYFIKYVS